MQQFIKIAFSRICREEFYITLDSDVFLLRKLDSGIFRDGRAPAKYEPVAAHPGWWDASAATLKASVSAKSFDENATFGVTPAFLKRDIASDLISTIDRLSHDSGEGDWISYLCARTHINDICWTEYSLYWTHLINTLNPADIYYAYDVYFYTHHVSEARRFLIAPHTIPRQLFAIIQSSMISQQEFSLFAKDYFDTMASID